MCKFSRTHFSAPDFFAFKLLVSEKCRASLMADRQKHLGQKNGSLESCTPLRQATIFLPFYFSVFLLVVRRRRKGRAGYFVSFVVILFLWFRPHPLPSTHPPRYDCGMDEQRGIIARSHAFPPSSRRGRIGA